MSIYCIQGEVTLETSSSNVKGLFKGNNRLKIKCKLLGEQNQEKEYTFQRGNSYPAFYIRLRSEKGRLWYRFKFGSKSNSDIYTFQANPSSKDDGGHTYQSKDFTKEELVNWIREGRIAMGEKQPKVNNVRPEDKLTELMHGDTVDFGKQPLVTEEEAKMLIAQARWAQRAMKEENSDYYEYDTYYDDLYDDDYEDEDVSYWNELYDYYYQQYQYLAKLIRAMNAYHHKP